MNLKLITSQSILLMGLILVYHLGLSDRPETTSLGMKPLFPEISIEQVAAIEISRGSHQLRFQRKQAETESEAPQEIAVSSPPEWISPSIHDYKVDTGKILNLLRQIQNLPMGELRGSNTHLSTYGLQENDRTTLSLRDTENRELLSLILGKTLRTSKDKDLEAFQPNPAQNFPTSHTHELTYLYLPQRKEIRAVPLAFEIEFEPKRWIDLKILPMRSDEVRFIEVVRVEKAGTIERVLMGLLEDPEKIEERKTYRKRRGNKKWKKARNSPVESWFVDLTQDRRGQLQSNVLANESKAEELIQTLAHLTALDVAEPVHIDPGQVQPRTEDLVRYGFDRPKVRVTVVLKDQSGLAYDFSKHNGKTISNPQHQPRIYCWTPRTRSQEEMATQALFSPQQSQQVIQAPVFSIEEKSYQTIASPPKVYWPDLEVHQIVIAWKGSTDAPKEVLRTKEEARTLAHSLLAEAQKNGVDFIELQKKHSSVEDTLWVHKGDESGRYDDLFQIQREKIHSAIIESPEGFRILKRIR